MGFLSAVMVVLVEDLSASAATVCWLAGLSAAIAGLLTSGPFSSVVLKQQGFVVDHLPVLRRVGRVLMIVGVLDIGFMIYCIANQMSYSSSLNIFAVIAGVLLLKGHLKAARAVTFVIAFLLTASLIGVPFVALFLLPLDYWQLVFRRSPIWSSLSIAVGAGLLVLLGWVYRELRSPVVVQAQAAAGLRSGVQKWPFVAGAVLSVLIAVMFQLIMKGEEAEEAKRRAARQYGPDYKYFVTEIKTSSVSTGKRVWAVLTAYNERTSKAVTIEWEE
ncbi:MAG TPA: hypothetical protein VK629_22035 [Steroidobacteraceae bacterium]|nr:hypothetical protein [Steroidobacteraceae bacterium]